MANISQRYKGSSTGPGLFSRAYSSVKGGIQGGDTRFGRFLDRAYKPAQAFEAGSRFGIGGGFQANNLLSYLGALAGAVALAPGAVVKGAQAVRGLGGVARAAEGVETGRVAQIGSNFRGPYGAARGTTLGGQVLVSGVQRYYNPQTGQVVEGDSNTIKTTGLIPLNDPLTDGSGTGTSDIQSEMLRRQAEELALAKEAFLSRSDRYKQFFEMQKAEAERQNQLAQQDIATARSEFGTQAELRRQEAGRQSQSNEARINALSNAAGTFDSSARLSDLGQNQQVFEQALTTLSAEEQKYYSVLDRQLQDLMAQIQLQKAQIDITEADTAEDIQAKLREFDMAELELQSQIQALRSDAVSKAQERTTAGADAYGNFFKALDNIAAFANNLRPGQSEQLIDEISQRTFGDKNTGRYYWDVYRYRNILNDPNATPQDKALAQQRLREIGIGG